MNKNVIIGVIVALVVIIGGYFLLKNNPGQPVETATTTTTTVTTTTTTVVAGAPVVETSTIVGASNSTAIVQGQVNPNGASTVYWFEYGETAGLGTQSAFQAIGSGYTLLPATGYITGLKANTVYYFRLSARNGLGTVNGATYSFKTNSNPPVQGVVPTVNTNSATQVLNTTANVNGKVNPNGVASVYWFEYGKDNSFGNITQVKSAGNGTALTSVSEGLTGLEPLTTYYFRINAQNQYGTINGQTLSFTTTGPAVPPVPGQPTMNTNPATNITTNGATLNGTVNPNGAQTTFWFEYGTDSLLGSLIGTGTTHQTIAAGTSPISVNASIFGLSTSTKYYYRIVGSNQYGTVRGDIVLFRTKTQ